VNSITQLSLTKNALSLSRSIGHWRASLLQSGSWFGVLATVVVEGDEEDAEDPGNGVTTGAKNKVVAGDSVVGSATQRGATAAATKARSLNCMMVWS
jgi:hypothetical protein